MPTAPATPCTGGGGRCPTLVKGGGRCAAHNARRQHERAYPRGSSTAQGYGAAWRKLRALVLREEPLCRACALAGWVTAASEVDHIVPRKAGGSEERANLQPLCKPCHARKTAIEDGRWG